MYTTHFHDNPAALGILEERARMLAQRPGAGTRELGEEVLVFQLGAGSYSLPTRAIREVQPLRAYTPLPLTPAFVLGLVNVRGRLLTAIDIRPLLDITTTPPPPDALLLIVSAAAGEVGLLADSVIEIRHTDLHLAPSLSTTAGRGVAWIKGVDQQITLLIDPGLLLADPRLVVNSSNA